MTGIAELHAQALDVTGRIVTGIPAGRWHAATPCPGWDARALLNHVVAGNLWAAELAAGTTIESVGSSDAIRSAIMMVGRWVLADGMSGITDASATDRRSIPWTAPAASTTEPQSGAGPMAHVPTGW